MYYTCFMSPSHYLSICRKYQMLSGSLLTTVSLSPVMPLSMFTYIFKYMQKELGNVGVPLKQQASNMC